MYNLLLSFLYTCTSFSTTIKLYSWDIVRYYNSFVWLSVPCCLSYFFIRLCQLVAHALFSSFKDCTVQFLFVRCVTLYQFRERKSLYFECRCSYFELWLPVVPPQAITVHAITGSFSWRHEKLPQYGMNTALESRWLQNCSFKRYKPKKNDEQQPNRSKYSSQNEMAVEKHQRKKKDVALKKLQII